MIQSLTPASVRMTSPAAINPATEGTNETLPGVLVGSPKGVRASSVDQTTRHASIPRLRSSLRITLASGHTDVS